MLRTLLAVAATLSLCGCPDVAAVTAPSPSAVMPPRYVAPARDTATTQQMLKYYFVQ
jgi:hypothetical protein